MYGCSTFFIGYTVYDTLFLIAETTRKGCCIFCAAHYLLILFLYSVPICEEPPLTNGMYAGQHDGPVYQQGEAITAICDPGYLLNGTTERQCIADGVWSGMDSTCDQGQWNALFFLCYL